jgi:hypothetical protein
MVRDTVDDARVMDEHFVAHTCGAISRRQNDSDHESVNITFAFRKSVISQL